MDELEVQNLVVELDADNSGSINLEEFEVWYLGELWRSGSKDHAGPHHLLVHVNARSLAHPPTHPPIRPSHPDDKKKRNG